MTRTKPIGPMLRLVLATGAVMSPLAGPMLRRRLRRGKEDPARVGEKQGFTDVARPDGTVIWMHGVGVGEVMALRGLIASLTKARPDLWFLVTSSARSSGDVFAANLPPRTIHQYLPLDLPRPVARFLDHWRPDLAVWSDQEVWPRLATRCARRGIPQVYVAARITDASAAARARFGRAYGDLYGLMDAIHAQDAKTAAHLRAMIGEHAKVRISGSLKAAAAPLAPLPDVQAKLPERDLIWIAASAHRADMDAALTAQRDLGAQAGTSTLLIIAPRLMADVGHAEKICAKFGLNYCKRSENKWPHPSTDVFIADSFGELGAWYAAADAALIGGTFDATQGHNPWEAIALDCAVLHGSHVDNFKVDFEQLRAQDAARAVDSPAAIVRALTAPDLAEMAARARDVQTTAAHGLRDMTADLLTLLDR